MAEGSEVMAISTVLPTAVLGSSQAPPEEAKHGAECGAASMAAAPAPAPAMERK